MMKTPCKVPVPTYLTTTCPLQYTCREHVHEQFHSTGSVVILWGPSACPVQVCPFFVSRKTSARQLRKTSCCTSQTRKSSSLQSVQEYEKVFPQKIVVNSWGIMKHLQDVSSLREWDKQEEKRAQSVQTCLSPAFLLLIKLAGGQIYCALREYSHLTALLRLEICLNPP